MQSSQQFVENVHYRVRPNSSETEMVKFAITQGLPANSDRVLYAQKPDGSRVAIPVAGRTAAIEAIGNLWAKTIPQQTHLGITLDPDGEIWVDTIELCQFSG